jgi:hypothetical protein
VVRGADDAAAIRWQLDKSRARRSGPVAVMLDGRISAFTGLPTVLG